MPGGPADGPSARAAERDTGEKGTVLQSMELVDFIHSQTASHWTE